MFQSLRSSQWFHSSDRKKSSHSKMVVCEFTTFASCLIRWFLHCGPIWDFGNMYHASSCFNVQIYWQLKSQNTQIIWAMITEQTVVWNPHQMRIDGRFSQRSWFKWERETLFRFCHLADQCKYKSAITEWRSKPFPKPRDRHRIESLVIVSLQINKRRLHNVYINDIHTK